MEDLKITPYQRLKLALKEDNDMTLSDKASKNLDELLGIEPEKKRITIWDKIVSIFNKIDSKIFRKSNPMYNTKFHSRKK
jgi:hypothetical protein